MATYVIGDLQGCFHSFQRLLEQIDFDLTHDRLWLVGDLINRGPGSLQVLRWLFSQQSSYPGSVTTVLGNHDLHALTVAAGIAPQRAGDTLQPLLDAPDGPKLFDWLRHQPMIYAEGDYLMVHAGLLPQWDAAEALALGQEVETVLQSEDYKDFLAAMYGNLPSHWESGLRGMDRLRLITNALTRLRICNPEGVMDLKFKGKPQDIPQGYLAWFDVPGRRSFAVTVLFGHWSALGLLQRDNLQGLDTGCLWGGKLTALRLEDRQLFAVPCDPRDQPRKINA
ncbi:MAG TPA: symmetrical bis(5'-nucleosyl)-tetraphosphatase [Methylophilaceae bacterium]|nr:symmetrical bis(5'-nucleosyl)-tetraphosphatase [Methylophilaceae bacterium]